MTGEPMRTGHGLVSPRLKPWSASLRQAQRYVRLGSIYKMPAMSKFPLCFFAESCSYRNEIAKADSDRGRLVQR